MQEHGIQRREVAAVRSRTGSRSRLYVLVLVVLAAIAAVVYVLYLGSSGWRRHVNKGLEFAASNKPVEAEAQWRDAIRVDPSRHEPYQLLSSLYLESDRADMAVPLLERLKSVAPSTPHTLCGLAEAYTRVDRIKEGLATSRQAVIVEPNCGRAHAILGVHLGQSEQTREAIDELTKANRLLPNDDKIAMSLAQAQLDAMDYPKAEALARAVLAKDPKYATGWYTLGRAFTRRTPTPENLKTAIDAFEKTVELNPGIGDAYAELGRLKVLSGDPQGAVKSLTFVWERGTRTKETAYNLAAAYRKIGLPKEAAKMSLEFKRLSDYQTEKDILLKRMQVHPGDSDIVIEFAELEVASGDASEAVNYLKLVLQERPHEKRALQAMVAACEKLKQPEMVTAYRERLAGAQRRRN